MWWIQERATAARRGSPRRTGGAAGLGVIEGKKRSGIEPAEQDEAIGDKD